MPYETRLRRRRSGMAAREAVTMRSHCDYGFAARRPSSQASSVSSHGASTCSAEARVCPRQKAAQAKEDDGRRGRAGGEVGRGPLHERLRRVRARDLDRRPAVVDAGCAPAVAPAVGGGRAARGRDKKRARRGRCAAHARPPARAHKGRASARRARARRRPLRDRPRSGSGRARPARGPASAAGR